MNYNKEAKSLTFRRGSEDSQDKAAIRVVLFESRVQVPGFSRV